MTDHDPFEKVKEAIFNWADDVNYPKEEVVNELHNLLMWISSLMSDITLEVSTDDLR